MGEYMNHKPRILPNNFFKTIKIDDFDEVENHNVISKVKFKEDSETTNNKLKTNNDIVS